MQPMARIVPTIAAVQNHWSYGLFKLRHVYWLLLLLLQNMPQFKQAAPIILYHRH
jgi:hypothetical protein